MIGLLEPRIIYRRRSTGLTKTRMSNHLCGDSLDGLYFDVRMLYN